MRGYYRTPKGSINLTAYHSKCEVHSFGTLASEDLDPCPSFGRVFFFIFLNLFFIIIYISNCKIYFSYCIIYMLFCVRDTRYRLRPSWRRHKRATANATVVGSIAIWSNEIFIIFISMLC